MINLQNLILLFVLTSMISINGYSQKMNFDGSIVNFDTLEKKTVFVEINGIVCKSCLYELSEILYNAKDSFGFELVLILPYSNTVLGRRNLLQIWDELIVKYYGNVFFSTSLSQNFFKEERMPFIVFYNFDKTKVGYKDIFNSDGHVRDGFLDILAE